VCLASPGEQLVFALIVRRDAKEVSTQGKSQNPSMHIVAFWHHLKLPLDHQQLLLSPWQGSSCQPRGLTAR
jgi:hypothetical protein